MARFKIKMKVRGLELEVDGTREDAPLIAQNLSRQFAGLLEPAAHIVEGEVERDGNRHAAVVEVATAAPRNRKPRRAPSPTGSASGGNSASLSWKHDPTRWGNPQQTWSGAEKTVWLLYVAGQEGIAKEMASSVIVSTFNKMFREAGLLRLGNMKRDLGKFKSMAPPLLGEDATKAPPVWFLTQEGTKKAEELVQQARGQRAAEA